MKTYTTSGTGSQQTLSEIETDKIPVYEDESAVEADLANLEVGQIVATKDTGSELSAPVDVVQSGNMHAVTSNAVAESLSYSTEETATGGKWIDGKPIYRKVIDCGALPNSAFKTVNHNISNLEKVIKLYGFANNTAGTDFITLPFVDTASSATFNTSLRATNTQITLKSDNNMASYSGYAIIEYTKTTD